MLKPRTIVAALLLLALSTAPAATLSWAPADPADQVTSWNVYQAIAPSTNFVLIATATTNTRFVAATTVGTYSWYVTAVSQWGESLPSNIVTARPFPPAAPTGLSCGK